MVRINPVLPHLVKIFIVYIHSYCYLIRYRRHKKYMFDPWVGKILWRRVWQPTPVFLPGESHRQRSLGGYSPQGCKESDMTGGTEHTHMHICAPSLSILLLIDI